MKHFLPILFFILAVNVSGYCQSSPAFTPLFYNFGLSPDDVSVKEKTVQAESSYSFTIKQVPGQNLFVWVESSDTASNVLLKPYHNFQVKNGDLWNAYLYFPKPGVWHIAVFFIPAGSNQLLNLFGFTVNASAAAADADAIQSYTSIVGKQPE